MARRLLGGAQAHRARGARIISLLAAVSLVVTAGAIEAPASAEVVPPSCGSAPFPDVGVDHPFCVEIRWFVDQGIGLGYPDGLFRPGNAVSRQAGAEFLWRAAGSPPGPYPDPGFTDVPPFHLYLTSISWLATQVDLGAAGGAFAPTGTLERGELARWMHQIAGTPSSSDPAPTLTDVPAGTAGDAIRWTLGMGYLEPATDTTFAPAGAMTREVLAGALYRRADQPRRPPSKATGVQGFRWSAGEVVITWSAPVTHGGRPVTGYELTWLPSGDTEVVESWRRIWWLSPVTATSVRVRARNEIGFGPAVEVPVAGTAPGTPTMAQGAAVEEGMVAIWQAPTAGSAPITHYVVTANPGGVTEVVPATPDLWQVAFLVGLPNGVPVTASIVAVSSVGTSRPATVSATPQVKACVGWLFVDVPAGHPACGEITWLVSQGITTGYDDGTFRPNLAVSRQSMAAFLTRFAGVDPFDLCVPGVFTDVGGGHPFCDEITWLVGVGITGGYPDGTFRPTAPVSRQSMAAFLARLVDAPLPACDPTAFTDVGAGNPFCAEITWAVDAGVAAGYPDGTFKPTAPVSRRAMAAFLYRLDHLPG